MEIAMAAQLYVRNSLKECKDAEWLEEGNLITTWNALQ
jgi:hypothetical protein